MTIVSDRDRHLFHMGTETTIGTTSTYNRMFIRFSNQEDPEVYTRLPLPIQQERFN
jgi:hypothetical protein